MPQIVRSSKWIPVAVLLSLSACAAEEREFSTPCKALICDDFESSEVGAAPAGRWRVGTSDDGMGNMTGAVAVDSTRAFSGNRSVKISTVENDNWKSAQLIFADTSALPTKDNVVFGRAMVWVESVPDKNLTWGLITGKGMVPGETHEAYYRYGGSEPVPGPDGSVGSKLAAFYDTPGSYDVPPSAPETNCWNHATSDIMPVGRWACVEWKFDGGNDEMQLWLDGFGIPGLNLKGTGQGCTGGQSADFVWKAPTFTEILVGWETGDPDVARTIWVDDVVIGAEKVGCP
ncbi:hypothetical protein [Polyangium aurulentum]|uniref:hypothetical protein n=1 Tax=Polyangium aurulentum TaxID=2567896 RepID=UPI0010AE03D8|nr:hypothetical protein [Polyangium aurulentum]UQA54601.1 hypothetical protein E8A73_024835 [Polyangium aurulentum]